MKRRDFLKSALGAAAVAPFARSVLAADEFPFRANDRVTLGPKKIDCSRLFLGTGSHGWNHSSAQTRGMSVDTLARFLIEAYDQGITSWDSADRYGSHPHLARALELGVPRDKVTILTKSWARTPEQMREDIPRYLRELGTDTIDIFLLHCLEDPDWPRNMRGAMDVVSEFQDKGIIRSKGVSCHSLGALRTAAKEPWVEIDLARINPRGVAMDADPHVVAPVLEEMKAAGKGVIGMKILGDGKLVDAADESLAYVLNLPSVDAVTIGFENSGQRDDIVARIARTPRAA